MKLSELVAKYIELRDKKSQYKAEYDAKVAQLDINIDKIEAALLKTFETAGMDSVKTEFGTAYTTVQTSATVADADVFRKFVKDNDAWEMFQARVSKTAVEQYKAVHGDIPPGLNWREERVVNVRRAS
jgi:hypothetical protein